MPRLRKQKDTRYLVSIKDLRFMLSKWENVFAYDRTMRDEKCDLVYYPDDDDLFFVPRNRPAFEWDGGIILNAGSVFYSRKNLADVVQSVPHKRYGIKRVYHLLEEKWYQMEIPKPDKTPMKWTWNLNRECWVEREPSEYQQPVRQVQAHPSVDPVDSPVYVPSSPVYNPTSPAYDPPYSPESIEFSATSGTDPYCAPAMPDGDIPESVKFDYSPMPVFTRSYEFSPISVPGEECRRISLIVKKPKAVRAKKLRNMVITSRI